jgi:hypothetical protein
MHRNRKKKYLGGLLSLGFTVHIVNEGDGWLSRVKKRQFVEGWLPISSRFDKIGAN